MKRHRLLHEYEEFTPETRPQDPHGDGTGLTFTTLEHGGDLSTILGSRIVAADEEGVIPTTQIQPIGLIVNELVTNAAKHGTGTIDVSYRIDENTRELAVCDEGEGIPAGFDPEVIGSGLGMKVVNSLARQLGGRVTATARPDRPGCCFRVMFPA